MMFRKIASLLLSVVLSLGLVASANADIGPYKWRAHSPFFVILVSSLNDPSLQSLAVASASDWSQSSAVDFVFGSQPKRGIFVKIVDGYYGPTWSGLTSISNDHGYIVGATIYLNRTNLDSVSDTFKKAVICQELGHSLGLDHRNANDSCMSEFNIWPTPSVADFVDLVTMYGN
jgi:hypothetical protein